MKRIDIPGWFHRIGMAIIVGSFLLGSEHVVPIAITLVCLTALAMAAVWLQKNARKRHGAGQR